MDCYPEDQTVIANGQTAEMVRQRNSTREKAIREEMDLEVFYECRIRDMLRTNREMRDFFDNTHDSGAINLR